MEPNRKKILLQKLLNNECSKEELEELLSFKGSSEFDKELGAALDEEWASNKDIQAIDPLRSEEIFYNILLKDSKQLSRDKIALNQFYRIAAVILMLIMFSGLFYWFLNVREYQTIKTAYGKTQEIKLPDGSLVTLNGNSSIRYKRSLEKEEPRILTLQGEAFFKVMHKPNDQKFIVETNVMKVEVLGTEFNVLARHRSSSVVLKSGKVKLAVNGRKDIIMKSGELVEVNSKSKAVRQSRVNAEAYTSWRNHLLSFESASLQEISDILKETYGIKIRIDSKKLGNERFTGTFPADEDINILLSMLSKTYEFSIIKKDDEIIFKK